MSLYPPEVIERFWNRVKRNGKDQCWPWLGPVFKEGYGQFQPVRRKGGSSHRFACELGIGRKLRPGECALHSCDNRICVNPNHLFPGTKKNNTDDMFRKGRNAPQSWLIDADIAEIQQRAKAENYRYGINVEFAREFRVTPTTIGRIIKAKRPRYKRILQSHTS